MLKRIQLVKAREDMLLDTINSHYNIYYNDLWDPYLNWRKLRTEEITQLKKLETEAMARKVLGAAAILGAIALGASSNENVRVQSATLRTVMIAGGTYGLYSGFKKSEETTINKEVIEELGESFSSAATPLTVEVEGQTVRLTGSAEQQYKQWRELLTRIYQSETGFSATDQESITKDLQLQP